jgi:hypothetical protein
LGIKREWYVCILLIRSEKPRNFHCFSIVITYKIDLQQQVEEQPNTYQQYELSNPQVDTQEEYEVAIIDNTTAETPER